MAQTKKRTTTRTRKKKKKKSLRQQLKLNWDTNDERIYKILGLLSLLTSLYLFIAFVSYLFTWYIDQNEVLNRSWGILADMDVEMANWLGRLGAIVSHQFFYLWFGVPSFIFVFIFFITGISLILRRPLRRFYKVYRYSFLILLWSSLLLAFLMVEPGLIARTFCI